MNRRMFFQAVAVGSVLLVLAALAAVALGSPADGVTPTVLARGTYDSFKVRSYPQGPGDFKAEAKEPTDIVVRATSTRRGRPPAGTRIPARCSSRSSRVELTFYEYDDPTCTPIVKRAGEGYVDTGRGHIARNETRSARQRHDRDHRAGGRCVPRRARRSRAQLQLLSTRGHA